MTISDQSRYDLHQRLAEVLGEDEAATLMEHLPPVGWADVATKRDVDQLGQATKRDIDELAQATKRDIDQLAQSTKHDVGQLSLKLDHLGRELRLEMAAGFAGVRGDLHQEVGALRSDMQRQLPTLLIGLVGLQVSGAGLAVALSRLL